MRYVVALVFVVLGAAVGSYVYLSSRPLRAAEVQVRAINLGLRNLPLPATTAQWLRESRDGARKELEDATDRLQLDHSVLLALIADSVETDGDARLSARQLAYTAEREVMRWLLQPRSNSPAMESLKNAAANPTLLARGGVALRALSQQADHDASLSLPFGTTFLENEIVGQIGAAGKWSTLHKGAPESSTIDYVLAHDAILDIARKGNETALNAAVKLALADPRVDDTGRDALNRYISPVPRGIEMARAAHEEPAGGARLLGGETPSQPDEGPAADFASIPECPPDPRCPD